MLLCEAVKPEPMSTPPAADTLELERRTRAGAVLSKDPGALTFEPEQIGLIPQAFHPHRSAADVPPNGGRRRPDSDPSVIVDIHRVGW